MSDNLIDSLVEMGFSRGRAEMAVCRSGSQDLSFVMDWLLSHEEELDAAERQQHQQQQQQPLRLREPTPESQPATEPPPQEPSVPGAEPPEVEPESSAGPGGAGVAKSIKCEDCGKLFTTQEEVDFHATKSGHQNFAESTEEKRALTDKEKDEQLANIMSKLKQRRLDREAREKEEALQKEKNRIKSGKELLEAKKKHDELEMKKLVEQRKREKEEERLAKQRVRDAIEQDKLARRAKSSGAPLDAPPPVPQSYAVAAKTTPVKLHEKVKIQVRLANGNTLVQTFGAKEPLHAVKVFIEMNMNDHPEPFNLMINYPRKVFEGDDYEKPLDSLGLAPTATLFLTKV